MAGFGWQEIVILAVLALIYVTPIWIMVSATRYRHGTAWNGWVVSSFFFGWLALLLWVLVGRRLAPTR
ncbi:MAG: hypothetical protein M3464_15545 [Chloroflexota bacterium]|nr:hypothetical protein [Chloroflexota bacterium]